MNEDHLFRVSLKALIRNDKGEVLVVRENGGDWQLPGGGLDAGEDIKEGLARELYEEIRMKGHFTAKPILIRRSFVERLDEYQILILFEVVPENMTFGNGDETDEWAFKDPEEFKDSNNRTPQFIYDYANGNDLTKYGVA